MIGSGLIDLRRRRDTVVIGEPFRYWKWYLAAASLLCHIRYVVAYMDDYELDRIASDNPALTALAAQRAPIRRLKSQGQTTSKSQSTGSQATPAPLELTKYDVCVR